MFRKTFIFASLCLTAFAGPTGLDNERKCSSSCTAPVKFDYKTGNAYYYKYTSDVITTVNGDDRVTTGVHVTTLVELVATSTCEYLLVLHDATVKESSGETGDFRRTVENSEALVQELIGKPLRFSFNDGKIDLLCSGSNEPMWVLNFKRGILSAMQNTMDNFEDNGPIEEVDVHGKCVTTYEVNDYGRGQAILKKTKDMADCTERPTFVNALQSMPYASGSLIQSLPILSGRQECIQIIDDGKISSINCEEIHTFDPFSKDEAKAQTLVSQSLTFSSQIRKTFITDDEDTALTKRKLVYERHVDPVEFKGEVSVVMDILNRLKAGNEEGGVAESTYDFIELVDRLRRVNYADFTSIMQEVSGTDAELYLLDAIPIVASTPSVRMMVDLIIDNKINEDQSTAWLSSLMFIRDPTLDMIVESKRLIQTTEPRNQAFLGVSTLVYAYCQGHADCEDEADVQELVQSMHAYLGNGCSATTASEVERIIYALKGIGNAGLLATDGEATLSRCFESEENALEIRLAAIDALRRVPCGDYEQEKVFTMFENAQADTELRIKAYLMLWKCPSPQLLEQVRSILTNEPVNQVSWFVWTHLANLKETLSPDKQDIRELLGDEFLIEKFNGDARKFSRNYEAAYFTEDESMGGTSDINVIFTPESFLPRSASANLTAHLFGKSFNIFEIGGRVSSLEQLLEPLFGPKGYFPDKRVTQALDSHRRKRDVSQRVNGLKDLYEHADLHSGGPSGSVYARIFGNELIYKTLELQHTEFNPGAERGGGDWLDIKEIFGRLLQGRDIQYHKSSVLFDLSYSVPTGAGLPLTIAAQSAATVGLQASGKFDMGKLLATNEVDINGRLEPRGAIHVDGWMSTQLGGNVAPVRNGIRLQNELHTSTAIQGEVIVRGSKLVHASLSLPKERMEIFKATSQILTFNTMRKPSAVDSTALTQSRSPGGETFRCFESDAVGLKLCGEWIVPEDGLSYPPLDSPVTVSLYLLKTDSISNYQFDYRFNMDEEETSLSVLFDTPGSTIDRRYAANFLLSSETGKLDASLYTPWTSLGLEGKYSLEQKYVQLTVDVQEDQVLFVNAGMNGIAGKYEPKFLVRVYNHTLAELEGEVTVSESLKRGETKANFNLELKHMTETPITLAGNVSRNGDDIQTRAQLVSPLLTGGIRSQLVLKQGHLVSKVNLDYSWNGGTPVLVDVNAKAKKVSRKDLTKISSAFSFSVRDSPDKNLELNWEMERTTGYCETMLRFILAKSTWEARSLYKFQRKSDSLEMALAASLAAPKHGVDYKFEAGHLKNATIMQSKIMGRIRADREFKAEMVLADESTSLLQHSLLAKALWPSTEYTVRATVKENTANDYNVELVISPNDKPEMKATITYKNGSGPTKIEHTVTFRARGVIQDPISGHAGFSAADTEAHLDTEVRIEASDGTTMKWGGSLDCKQVKRNAVRVEGKLVLDDRKYTGEMNVKTNKSGAKVLSLDLQGGNRILLEAMVNGDILGPLATVVTLYPDKDNRPDYKFAIDGRYDRQSVQVTVDYFGSQTIVTLLYDADSKVQLNCQLWDGKRYSVTVQVPQVDASGASIFVQVETPIQDYEVMVFSSSYGLSDQGGQKTLEAKVEGRLNQMEGVFITSGTVGDGNGSAMFTLDATGMKSMQGNVRAVWHEHEKSLSVMAARDGGRGRALRAELIHNTQVVTAGFFFSGCGNLPEITVELEHQMRNQINSYGKVGWKFDSAKSEEVSVHVTGTRIPLRGKVSATTPWRKFEKTVINYALDLRGEGRTLEIGFDADCPYSPANLKLVVENTDGSFNYEVLTSWQHGRRTKSYHATATGYYFSLADANVEANFTAGDKSYQLRWASERDYRGSKAEVTLSLNKEKFSSGLELSMHPQNRETTVGLWLERPASPRLNLQLVHVNIPGKMKLNFQALNDRKILVKSENDLEHRGIYFWNLTSTLETALDWWPDVRLSSSHAVESPYNVEHVSRLHVGDLQQLLPSEGQVEGENTEDLSAGEFSFRMRTEEEATFLHTHLKYDDDDIKLTGSFNMTELTKNMKLEMTSTFFPTTEILFENTKDPMLAKFAISSPEMPFNYVSFNIQRSNDPRADSIRADFVSDYGINLEAQAIRNKEQNSLSVKVRESAMDLLDLAFSGKLETGRGEAHFSVQVDMLEIKKSVDTDFSLEDDELRVNGKLVQGESIATLELIGTWGERKALRITTNEDDDLIMITNIELTNARGTAKLSASVTANEETVFASTLTYNRDDSVYELGLHSLHLQVTSIKFEPFEARASLGLQPDGLNIKTDLPIPGWEIMEVSVQGSWLPERKAANLAAKRNGDEYSVNAYFEKLSNGSDVSVKVTSPFEGHRFLELSVKYAKGRGMSGAVRVAKEFQALGLEGTVRSNHISVKIQTPFRAVESAAGTVTWNLSGLRKTAKTSGELNGEKFEATGDWAVSDFQGDVQLLLTHRQTYAVTVKYDLSDGYAAEFGLQKPGTGWEVTGKGKLSLRVVELELKTPYRGFEDLGGRLSCATCDKAQANAYNVKADWKWNQMEGNAQFDLNFGKDKCHLRATTTLEGYRNFTLTLTHAFQQDEKIVSFEGQFENRAPFQIAFRSDLGDALDASVPSGVGKVKAVVEFPYLQYNYHFDATYNREREVHSLVARLNGHSRLMFGLQATLKNGQPLELNAELEAPHFDVMASTRLKVDLRSLSFVNADLRKGSKKYEGEALVNTGAVRVLLKTTDGPNVKLVQFSGEHFNGKFKGQLELDQQKYVLQGEILLEGLGNTKINIETTTPFEQYRSLAFHVETVSPRDGEVSAALSFENAEVRYMAKINGTYDTSGEVPKFSSFNVTIKSPLQDFEDLEAQFRYDITDGTSTTVLVNRKEKKELEIEFQLIGQHLKAKLDSQIPKYGVNGNIEGKWQSLPFKATAFLHLREQGHQMSLDAELNGMKSGDFKLATGIRGWETTRLNWDANGNLNGGNALVKLTAGDNWERSSKISWKVDAWKVVKLEAWAKTDNSGVERGFATVLSFNRKNSRIEKVTVAVRYVILDEEQNLALTVSLKRSADSFVFDGNLQTPFEVLSVISAHGKLMIRNEPAVDVLVSVNDEVRLATNAVVSIQPLKSRFKLNFNAPGLCEPFSISTQYDVEATDKFLELAFSQSKYAINVRANATVPEAKDSNEIELHVNVLSNVPMIEVSASGSMKAGYRINSDETRELVVSVNSERTGKWEVVATFRPTLNFLLKLDITSPNQDLCPTVNFITNYRGSAQQGISFDVSLQLYESQAVELIVTTSAEKLLAEFKSGIPGLQDLQLEAKTSTGQGYTNKKLEVEMLINGEKLSLNGYINAPARSMLGAEGSLELSSTLALIPEGNLKLQMDSSGNIEIRGNWGTNKVSIIGFSKFDHQNKRWTEGAETSLTLSANDNELMTMQLVHLFSDPIYSLNVTFGDGYKLESYVKTDSEKVLLLSVQYDPSQTVRVMLEAGSGKFKTVASTPWTPAVEANGMYSLSSREQMAKGSFVYDGQISSLEILARNSDRTLDLSLKVAIPALAQQLDATLGLRKLSDQLVRGNMNIALSDREVTLEGELTDIANSGANDMVKSKRLKLSLKLPDVEQKEIGADIVFQYPKTGLSSLLISGNVSTPTEVTSGVLGYELPINGAQILGLTAKINSAYLSSSPMGVRVATNVEKYELLIVEIERQSEMVKLEGRWLFPELVLRGEAALPRLFPERKKFSLDVRGRLNWPQDLSLRMGGNCGTDLYAVEGEMRWKKESVFGRIFVNAPKYLTGEKEIRLDAEWTDAGRHAVSVAGSWDQKRIQVDGQLITQVENKAALLKVGGLWGNHFVQGSWEKIGTSYELGLNAESGLLRGKRLSISSTIKPVDDGFEMNVSCRTRGNLHTAKVIMGLHWFKGKGLVEIKSVLFDTVRGNVEWEYRSATYSTAVNLEIFGEEHEAMLKYNARNAEVELVIKCPMISKKDVVAKSKLVLGDSGAHVLGEVNWNGGQWRFEGITFYRGFGDMEVKLDVRTPYDDWDRVTFGGKMAEEEISGEIHTPYVMLPKAELKISGLPLFRLDSLTLTSSVRPLISVKLPWFSASLAGVYQLPKGEKPGEFYAGIEYLGGDEREERKTEYKIRIEVPGLEAIHLHMANPVRLRIEGKFPFGKLETFEWELGGRINWKSWVEITAIAEINGKKIEFRSEVGHENGNRSLSLLLKTPFPQHEKYVASIKLDKYSESGTGRKLLVEFQHPGWEQFIKLEIDYRYRFKSLTDMDGEISITTPKVVVIVPKIMIRLNSSLHDEVYQAVINAEWGETKPSLALRARLTETTVSVSGDAALDDVTEPALVKINLDASRGTGGPTEDYGLNFLVRFRDEPVVRLRTHAKDLEENIDLSLQIMTQFEPIKSAGITFKIHHLGLNVIDLDKMVRETNINVQVEHNGERYFQIELINSVERRSIRIHNPVFPVSLSLVWERRGREKLIAQAEICWDTRYERQKTMGVEFLANVNQESVNAAFKAQYPTLGGSILTIAQSKNQLECKQSARIAWFAPVRESEAQEIGYTWHYVHSMDRKDGQMLLELYTPWRSVQTTAKVRRNSDKESRCNVELKWDLRKNENKRLGFEYMLLRSNYWGRRTANFGLRLFHSALSFEPGLTLNRIYAAGTLRHLKLNLQPSRKTEEDVVLEWNNFQDASLHSMSLIHLPSRLNSSVYVTATQSRFQIDLHYVDTQGVHRQGQLIAHNDAGQRLYEINHSLSKHILIRLETISGNFRQVAALQILDTAMNATLYAQKPWVEFAAKYNRYTEVHFVGGLAHRREAMVRMWRVQDGQLQNNKPCLHAELVLNSSKHLAGKLEWDDDCKDDVIEAMDGDLTLPEYDVLQLEQLKDNLLNGMQEAKARWQTISPVVRSNLENIAIFSAAELQKVYSELRIVLDIISEAYEDNFLFIKDVVEYFENYVINIKEMCTFICDFVAKMSSIFVEGVENAYAMMESFARKLEETVIPMWDAADAFLKDRYDAVLRVVRQVKTAIRNLHADIINVIRRTVEVGEEKFFANSFVQRVVKWWEEFVEWKEGFLFRDDIDLLLEYINVNMIQPIRDCMQPYVAFMENLIKDGMVEELLETPPVPYLIHCWQKVQEGVEKFLQVVQAEQTLKKITVQALRSLDELIARNTPRPQIVWEPQDGKIAFQQPLILFEWEDFTVMPALSRSSEENEKDFVTLTDYYYKTLDMLQALKPALDMNVRDILPPFQAHAIMAGDHHYYTFDKTYYRFSGDCSYVLFADLLHKNFTFIVNYGPAPGGMRKKSYTLLINPNHMIEIDVATLRVTLNDDSKVDLPTEVGTTFLRRFHNVIEVYDSRGFQITCSKEPAVCVFSVSGWYFGKTAGLLGTYDNEPSNDFRSPEKVVMENATAFAHSWRVGPKRGECRLKNLSTNDVVANDVDGICESHFVDRNSALRPCFSRVDTTVFMNMCKYDVSRDVNRASRRESACTAISAYVSDCQRQGVDLWLPSVCVTCKLEDGTALASGENATLTADGPHKYPESTDVVILLEQSNCFRKQDVGEIVKRLEGGLRAANLTDMRYALITYGGQGAFRNAHLTAFFGNIWVHSTLFKVPSFIKMNGDGNGNLYNAIEYAARTLKFRAGVSKTFIALTCGDEDCGSPAGYADELTLLVVNDIKLHLLTPKAFKLQKSKKNGAANQVFGLDFNGAFTNNHWRRPDMSADKALKRHVSMPKDYCTPLALESKGSRFHFEKIHSKSFEVWVNRVSLSAEPSPCQQCECIPDKSGSPHIHCTRCIPSEFPDLIDYDPSEDLSTSDPDAEIDGM